MKETTYRLSMNNGNPRSDRPNNDREEDHPVRNDDRKMPPLIRQKLRECKRGELTVACSEAYEDVSSDGLANVVRCCSHNGADEDEDVAEEDEISAAEEIAIGSADHEGDRSASSVDRCDPVVVD